LLHDSSLQHLPSRLALMNWSLFATNVGPKAWAARTGAKIFRLAGGSKFLEKSWKSHFRWRELDAGPRTWCDFGFWSSSSIVC
jgi:hypothetical protein